MCGVGAASSLYFRLEWVMQTLIFIWFLAGFRPNLGPRPVPTGRARTMVQNAPQISPGEQFQDRSVTIFWSKPTIQIKNVSLSEGKSHGKPRKGGEWSPGLLPSGTLYFTIPSGPFGWNFARKWWPNPGRTDGPCRRGGRWAEGAEHQLIYGPCCRQIQYDPAFNFLSCRTSSHIHRMSRPFSCKEGWARVTRQRSTALAER